MNNEYIISVVMSVYNGEKYLKKAIESILNQTYINLEFIIVNDGSTDSSLKIIKQYQQIDDRIVLIDQENIGLTKSLNKAIKIAKGEYIARMDADDISLQNRFEIQIKIIQNLDLDFVFSQAISFTSGMSFISPNSNLIEKFKFKKLAFGNIFVHGTFICKSSILKNNLYDENIKYAQDYELFCRLIDKGYAFFILPEVLYFLRIDSNSISNIKQKEQSQYAKQIAKKYFKTDKFFIADKNIFLRIILKLIRNFI